MQPRANLSIETELQPHESRFAERVKPYFTPKCFQSSRRGVCSPVVVVSVSASVVVVIPVSTIAITVPAAAVVVITAETKGGP